jgi:hypothetical protein
MIWTEHFKLCPGINKKKIVLNHEPGQSPGLPYPYTEEHYIDFIFLYVLRDIAFFEAG